MLTATLFFKFEVDPGPGDGFMPNMQQRQDILEQVLKEWPTYRYTFNDNGHALVIEEIVAEFDIDAE